MYFCSYLLPASSQKRWNLLMSMYLYVWIFRPANLHCTKIKCRNFWNVFPNMKIFRQNSITLSNNQKKKFHSKIHFNQNTIRIDYSLVYVLFFSCVYRVRYHVSSPIIWCYKMSVQCLTIGLTNSPVIWSILNRQTNKQTSKQTKK